MSRDDEDEVEITRPKPPPPKRTSAGFVMPSGELTPRGVEKLRHWWSCNVTEDCHPGEYLHISDVMGAFEADESGFPISGDENETAVVSVSADNFVNAVQSFCKTTICDHQLEGRRLRDKLGVQFRLSDSPSEPIEWLVKGILPQGSVSLLVAPPYELKTWIAMSLARAVSYGEPWLGRFAIEHRYTAWNRETQCMYRALTEPTSLRCLHLDFEMGPVEVDRRRRLLKDGRTGRSSLCPLTLADPLLWTEQLPLLDPVFVTVDSLSRGNPGVDEKIPAFAEPLARAKEYAAKHGTTFLFLAHSPKDLGGKGLMDVIRGSSAIAAAVDCAYFLQAVSAADADDPREKRARMTCFKMRNGGVEPEPLMVKLTDAAGVELYERKAVTPAPTESKEDKVMAAVVAEPGCSLRRVSEATGIRKETTAELLKDLETDGRVRSESGGKGVATRYFEVETGVPNVPSADHSGTPPSGTPSEGEQESETTQEK